MKQTLIWINGYETAVVIVLDELREKALNLPLLPGVYIMHDDRGEVIYVGKAKMLKNRVSSYFHGSHNAKTELMISKIHDFEVIVASSEFEALVLENSLIKHHMPKYNILLKDDKGYPFIRVDIKSEYPRFTVVSKTADDGAVYFGPYGGRGSTFSAIDAVSKAVHLPTCGKKFPRDIGKARPCLNHHMGACPAYCLKDTPKSDYIHAVEEAVMVFEGKTDKLIARLEEKMKMASEELKFENAAELRDRIKAIELLKTRQHVLSSAMADTDVVGFVRDETRSCFVVLHYINGSLLDKDFQFLNDPMEDDGEAVSGLVRQYYSMRGAYPKNVCLPCEIPDLESLEMLFTEESGHRVRVTVPHRGDKVRLVSAANTNAREEISRVATNEERVTKTAQWLMKTLGLPKTPDRIEAFDISNTGSSDIVASMTVFCGGKPLKKAYRKFKIKSTDTQNDYLSMAEVVSRRFKRYNDGDGKFDELPDIMLIDGGVNHAMTAKRAMQLENINVPVFGMVKDDRHRTRALVSPEGEEIGIVAQPGVFAFIGRIQEETHRFAIEYHRKLRSKSSYGSELDGIEGVGSARKQALLKKFKSLKAIKNAQENELSEVVPKSIAKVVYNHFHGENGE